MVDCSPAGSELPKKRHLTKVLRSVIAAGVSVGAALLAVGAIDPPAPAAGEALPHHELAPSLFATADGCMACHNGLATSLGEDVSIGSAWRASMMANSARDPYWQASVRREVLDHPERAAQIQDECSTCHMPMMRYEARLDGKLGGVFAHLPIDNSGEGSAALAGDGVSCTLCHQMLGLRPGTPASFNGGFTVEVLPPGKRPVFGPYEIDEGRRRVMHSSSGYIPTKGDHMRASELCATCHTLYTTVHGPNNQPLGRLPEQVPFLEWKHSEYTEKSSCQSCHMPPVTEPLAISSVLGTVRESMGRHDFRGGNFFMLAMLNRYRAELGVTAQPGELDAGVRRTITHLERETAGLTIEGAQIHAGRLEATVAVRNLTGHKFPTAYPSRRAWLQVTVRDRNGTLVFESGAIGNDGAIKGNDNDADGATFEPHYASISRADQVQIYESILHDAAGRVTTGLLSALRYAKDNRLLPSGFEKRSAGPDIAVRGEAAQDADFQGGGDRVAYSIDVSNSSGPYEMTMALRFQPIAYRWARNLASREADERSRFVAYYEAMSAGSSIALVTSSVQVR